MSRLLAGTALVLILAAAPLAARDYSYSFGGGGGLVSLSGGDFYSFKSQEVYTFSVGHRPAERWLLDFSFSSFTLANDTDVDSSQAIDTFTNNMAVDFSAMRLGLTANRLIFDPDQFWNVSLGLGGGLLVWSMDEPSSNSTFKVANDDGVIGDFGASEVFVTGAAGLHLFPLSQLSFNVSAQADYLTGAGVDILSDLESSRDRWLYGASARLMVHFGGGGKPAPAWRSDTVWSAVPQQFGAEQDWRRDGDADGVPDDMDSCLNTPPGVAVDDIGCPRDSDFDGVPDGVDDCPSTPVEAIGFVDIHGCPVDSDFDGVPDYLDACRFNAIGAIVDSTGCPLDSDGDGVANGLDDCPATLVGVAVDQFGCIDLAMFAKPMVLNINYPPGSFEVDPNNLERLKKLAGLLNFVPDIRLDIYGYTDNVGTAVVNRALSEKRANRVRDYLVTFGVEKDRIKVFGRGEVDFVASNQTAEGRNKNRRIEIVFYR